MLNRCFFFLSELFGASYVYSPLIYLEEDFFKGKGLEGKKEGKGRGREIN